MLSFFVRNNIRWQKSKKQLTLDEKIFRIHKSTKTLLPFGFVQKVHNHLRQKFKFYYKWHLNPLSSLAHYSLLVICTSLAFSVIFLNMPHASAQTYTRTWDTKADFETNITATQLSTTALTGSVKLAANPSPAITYSAQFGADGTGDAQFNDPVGITVDSTGRVIVVDKTNNRLQVFSSDNTFLGWIGKDNTGGFGWHNPRSGKVGAGGTENGAFNLPNRVEVDINDNIYVFDGNNNRIQVFSSNGTFVRKFGSAGTGDGQFNSSGYGGVAIASNGDIYVSDYDNNRIQAFSSAGVFKGWIGKDNAGGNGWHEPGSGKTGVAGTGNGEFSVIMDVAIDSEGSIYAIENDKNVTVFDASHNFLRKFAASNAYAGKSLSFDINDNMYIAGSGYYNSPFPGHHFVVYSKTGTYLRGFGSYGSDDGKFWYPNDVVPTASGKLYVVDNGDLNFAADRVQVLNNALPFYDSGTLTGVGLQINAGGEAVWDSIGYNVSSLPTNTSARFRTRTSVNGSDWSDYSEYYSAVQGAGSLDLNEVDSQYLDIEVSLTGGLATPQLDDFTLTYIVNGPPTVSAVSASQSTAADTLGKVAVDYTVADSDSVTDSANISYFYSTGITLSGSITSTSPADTETLSVSSTSNIPAAGTVLIDNEFISYTGKTASTLTGISRAASGTKAASHNEAASVFVRCTTTTGTGSQTTGVGGETYQGTWDVKTDLPDVNLSSVTLKVVAHDGELANMIGSADSSTFDFETVNPVAGVTPIAIGSTEKVNNRSVSVNLSATDDSALKVALSEDSEVFDTLQDYASSIAYNLSTGDALKTVYVKFRDIYGNESDVYSDSVELDTYAPTPLHPALVDGSTLTGTPNYKILLSWDTLNNADFVRYSIERSIDEVNFEEVETLADNSANAYADDNLDISTTYYYRLRSLDDVANWSAYSETVSMRPAGTDQTPPQITGPDPSVSSQSTTATVVWLTDENSDSFVDFGTTVDYGYTQGKVEQTTSHSVELIGLDPDTLYHFRIRTRDGAGNLALGSDFTFRTVSMAATAGVPAITGATAQKPGADPEEVTIIWTTDKSSTSQVLYGLSEDNLGSETLNDAALNTTHYVKLTKLKPNTKYYYKARSVDQYGNEKIDEVKYFVTSQTGVSTPKISGVEVSDITLNSAIVSWETTVVTSSTIEYGIDINYGSKIDDQSTGSTTKHLIRLKDLVSGQKYHFRVLGQGVDNTLIASDDYVFSTLTLPVISNLAITSITSEEATITWSTNIETDSFVDFSVYSTSTAGAEASSQGRSETVKDHAVTLSNLTPATTYRIIVKSRDIYGNLASSDSQTFKTIIDTLAPIIKDLKSETSIITDANGVSKAQAIISWSTDEPSTSQIKYSEGVVVGDSYPLSTQEDMNLTTSHIVILSNLQPSSTYHLKVVSKDSSNNIGVSDDYTVLTLNQQTSLLQYIVQILEERFSWVRGFGMFQ
ncbi:MAG: fibronectin type III domain-containing protein [Patescibacteria group bacterium]